MSMLAGFPMVDQKSEITSDGRPSENAQEDCVAASICAMCMYLNGIKAFDHDKYNPDKFKDMAYGEALRNSGTAAIKYVDYCKSLGVKLWPLDGDCPYLVEQAHKFLAEGKPVLFTQDDWIVDTSLPEYRGWTHVAAWYADAPGTLTSMDPWGGFPRMKSDTGWVQVMRAREIWIAEKIVQPATVSGVPEGCHYDQPSHTLTAPNGVKVVLGFCTEVLKGNWAPWNHPVVNQYYRDPLEDSNPPLGPGDQQPFNDRVLGYPHNPQHPFEGFKNKVIVEYAGKELVAARQIADARWQQVQKYYNLSKQLHDTAVALQADNAKLQADLQALQQALPK